MSFGLEIKRLREDVPISVQKLADKIGVNADRLRKWEERDLNPRLEDVQKIESFFGMELAQVMKLKSIKQFLNVPREVGTGQILRETAPAYNDTIKNKLIASLERENARLQKDLDLSLGELRHNILLSRAIAETTQELLVESQAKQNKRKYEELIDSVSIKNLEKYQKLKEEGNFAYVGK